MNVMLAVLPLAILYIIERLLAQDLLFLVWVNAIFFILIFPHPTYLFFEAKHLTPYGGGSGLPSPADIIVFGLLSVLGLVLQIWTNLYLLYLLNLQVHAIIPVIIMSLLASMGGCLGLTDLVWLQGIWPPIMFKHLKMVIGNKKMMILLLATTIFLTLLTLLFI